MAQYLAQIFIFHISKNKKNTTTSQVHLGFSVWVTGSFVTFYMISCLPKSPAKIKIKSPGILAPGPSRWPSNRSTTCWLMEGQDFHPSLCKGRLHFWRVPAWIPLILYSFHLMIASYIHCVSLMIDDLHQMYSQKNHWHCEPKVLPTVCLHTDFLCAISWSRCRFGPNVCEILGFEIE